MKTKLTLSIDAAVVLKAKALSKRTNKSVSEIFEEAVEKAYDLSCLRTKSWSEVWGGSLNVADTGVAGGDRLAAIMDRSQKPASKRNKSQ